MRKPVIGITPNYMTARMIGGEEGILYTAQGYHTSVLRAGGVPYTLPFAPYDDVLEQLVGMCDGFLFTGGQDVDPSIYGELPWYKLDTLAPQRDTLEVKLLPLILKSGKPLIGHCRGMQMINAALGGTLYQDLPTQYPNFKDLLQHSQTEKALYPTHSVSIRENTLLAACWGAEAKVNSFHHQAVKDVAPGLTVTATAPDGMIEGLEMKDHPYLQLVQWHPEEMSSQDEGTKKWFEAFIEACRRGMKE